MNDMEVIVLTTMAICACIVAMGAVTQPAPGKRKRKPKPKPKPPQHHIPQRRLSEYEDLLGTMLRAKCLTDRNGMWAAKCPACGKRLWAKSHFDYTNYIARKHTATCTRLPEFIDKEYPI